LIIEHNGNVSPENLYSVCVRGTARVRVTEDANGIFVGRTFAKIPLGTSREREKTVE
jgi:hypothetical protein